MGRTWCRLALEVSDGRRGADMAKRERFRGNLAPRGWMRRVEGPNLAVPKGGMSSAIYIMSSTVYFQRVLVADERRWAGFARVAAGHHSGWRRVVDGVELPGRVRNVLTRPGPADACRESIVAGSAGMCLAASFRERRPARYLRAPIGESTAPTVDDQTQPPERIAHPEENGHAEMNEFLVSGGETRCEFALPAAAGPFGRRRRDVRLGHDHCRSRHRGYSGCQETLGSERSLTGMGCRVRKRTWVRSFSKEETRRRRRRISDGRAPRRRLSGVLLKSPLAL